MELDVSAEMAFKLQGVGVLGWLALLLMPRSKWRDPLVFISIALVASLYAYIILSAFVSPEAPPLDFFSLNSWLSIASEPYLIVGITTHFVAIDLLVARWMTQRFYKKCTLSTSVLGRVYFSLILIVTFMVCPIGILCYFLSCVFLFQHYSTAEVAAIAKVSPEARTLLDRRPIYFAEEWWPPFRTLIYILKGLAGLTLLVIYLAVVVLVVVPIAFVYYVTKCFHMPATRLPLSSPTFMRTSLARWRLKLLLTPKEKRGPIWHTLNRVFQIVFFAELGASFDRPHLLIRALQYTFGDFFPFGEGLGVAARRDVIELLQDQDLRKGPLSLGWTVSTAQFTFCKIMPVFLPTSSNDVELLRNSRAVIKAWLRHFPHDTTRLTAKAEAILSEILPTPSERRPSREEIYESFGSGFFFVATGGAFTPREKAAYHDAVVNAMIFLPDWFNFLLAGGYLERKGLKSYYVLRTALARHLDGAALTAALNEASKHDIPRSEALRLVSIIFSIAGAAAPSTLLESVINRLYDDPHERCALFRQSPRDFVLETARLAKGVPMVNVVARSPMRVEIGGEDVEIPQGTSLHCSLVAANRDPRTFGGPEFDQRRADEFDPTRDNLGELFFWNGLEKLIQGEEKQRPPRYCPGHDVSLKLIEYIAGRYCEALEGRDAI